MQHLVEDVRGALRAGHYYAALGLALALPDICGRLETPTTAGKARAIRWLKQHLQPAYTKAVGAPGDPHVFMTAEDCYALRCAYMHEGDTDIINQQARTVLDRFRFVVSPRGCLLHGNQLERVLLLDVSVFCEEVCAAVEAWMRSVPADVARRMAALPRVEAIDLSKGFSF